MKSLLLATILSVTLLAPALARADASPQGCESSNNKAKGCDKRSRYSAGARNRNSCCFRDTRRGAASRCFGASNNPTKPILAGINITHFSLFAERGLALSLGSLGFLFSPLKQTKEKKP